MILEKTKDEILIRLPKDIDLKELQDLLDYLRYKELTSNSNAKQEEIENLSEQVNKSIWENIIKSRDI